jgi:cytochrome c556
MRFGIAASFAAVIVVSMPLSGRAAADSTPVQAIMDTVIDPSADALWDVAGTVITAKGSVVHQPRTPQDWTKARDLAQKVVAGAQRLQTPRPVGADGHWKLADASTPGIRTAAQIQDDIARDPKRFYAAAARLQSTAQDAVNAIDKRDIPSLLDAGARIDAACEACHAAYWYPRMLPRALPGADLFAKAAIRP